MRRASGACSMRLVLFPAVLPALAGCASDAPEEVPATSPAAPASPSAAPAPSTVRLAHDSTSGEAASTTFLINTTGPYTVFIGFRQLDGSQPCAGIDPRIVVKEPSGATYADATGTSVMAPCEGGSGSDVGARLAVGTWSVEFSGRGAVLGVVEVTPE